MVTTFPDAEKQGGNLTVECILRGLKFAKEHGNIKKIRNLYIQLDNVSSNKCETVLAACGALIKAGICKKIKLNYLEVGHTHEDIDALIGVIVTKLRAENIATFSQQEVAIKEAVHKDGSQVWSVQRVLGITAYDIMFRGALTIKTGITGIKEVRITADSNGTPEFLYKVDSTTDGWYPRPFEDLDNVSELQKVFQHDDDDQGAAVELVGNPYPGTEKGERGKRQHWYYKVKFEGGDKVVFPMKCLPIKMNFGDDMDAFHEKLLSPPKQEYMGPLTDKKELEETKESIMKMVRGRNDEHHLKEWADFLRCLKLN